MLDEHGHGKAETHHWETEMCLHAEGDRHENHRADGLALEDQTRIHHKESEDDIQHPERRAGRDAHRIEGRIDHDIGQVGGV